MAQQVGFLVGLAEVAFDADFKRALTMFFAGARGDHDDRHVLEARVVAHVRGELVAVHARHLDVEQHQVRHFFLQLLDRVEAGTAVELPTYTPPAALPEQRRHPLIMVVDDSITMRKVTTRVLERAELDVITAKDGLDAVEKLQEKVPDLMLLDIEMPRMDGYELATYMRNDARLKDVPIIMVTSRTGEKHRQRALEIGVERYLGKPYQEADLLRNLQETLRLSRA